MEGFVQRMVEEILQLKQKIEKLSKFLKSQTFNELDDYQKSLLVRQYSAMCAYFEVLAARLELNKND